MDHQAAGRPETKHVSERKRRANRRNAQKSTGPNTRAGKNESRMNAVKSGLTAEHLVIRGGELNEDPEVFAQLTTGLREARRPVGMLEDILVETLAGCVWKDQRVHRYEAGAIQRELEARRAQETQQRHGLFQSALDSGDDLESSVEGIQHLLAGLTRAIEEVQQAKWSADSENLIVQHFGHLGSLQPQINTRPGGQAERTKPDEFDPKQFIKNLKAEYGRLVARLPGVEAREKRRSDAAVRSYTLPNAQDLGLLLRYATANSRKFDKTMALLRQLQADRGAGGLGAVDRGDQAPPHS